MFEKGMALKQGVSAVVEVAAHELGDKIAHGENEYVYAYNAGANAAIPIGACLDVITACSGVYSMAISGLSASRYKGVNRNVTVPTGNYFWMCVKGPVPSILVRSGAVAAGGLLFAASGATGALQSVSAPTGVLTTFGELGACHPWSMARIITSLPADTATANAYFYGAREFA